MPRYQLEIFEPGAAGLERVLRHRLTITTDEDADAIAEGVAWYRDIAAFVKLAGLVLYKDQAIVFEKPEQSSPTTLGDVLYAKSKAPVAEREWTGLIESIAAGDQLALHALYERAHRIAFTLIMRITANREAAEELTIDLFHDVWRRASRYNAANGTVLGWIMNQARSRAIDRSPAVDQLVSLPSDELRPTTSLQERLARRIAEETGTEDVSLPTRHWSEPEWENVATGIECKLLATDTERNRISMLVRLAPGASYPAHTHADTEELHLLDGELWIDERKLFAGDYNYGAPGAGDDRVWSETGCTCLLITSTNDVLRHDG